MSDEPDADTEEDISFSSLFDPLDSKEEAEDDEPPPADPVSANTSDIDADRQGEPADDEGGELTLPTGFDDLDTTEGKSLEALATSLTESDDTEEEALNETARTRFDDLVDRINTREQSAESAVSKESSQDLQSLPGFETAGSVLLLSQDGSDGDLDTCASAFGAESISTTGVMFVDITSKNPSRLDHFRETYETEPAAIATIHLGRSRDDATIDHVKVRDPADLKHLGISISKLLREWQDDIEVMHVCFHSLTELLRLVDEERVFRFIHVLLGRIEDAGGSIHVHLDSSTHGAETVALFEKLFDATITARGEELEYRSRP